MKKTVKVMCVFLSLLILLQGVLLLKDKAYLQKGIIRLHVVANSDSQADQQLKLKVRDAVLTYLGEHMDGLATKEDAMAFLTDHLPQIKAVAQQRVYEQGYAYPVGVSLQQEPFSTRDYETFSLPAGVYDALRVNIGSASGKNWWCVAFPNLCLPATGEAFVDTATDAGFPDSLTQTLENPKGYRIRFFLLERLGFLEKILFR